MTARAIILDAKPLSTADVAEVARRGARLVLGEEAMRRIRASRALIEHLTQLGKPLYGVTTGLGACVDTPLAQADLIAFQHSVPLSHSMGAGPSLPTEAVRALMTARICGMAAGGTGTSEGVVLGLLAALNAGVHPIVPSWGSVGAADLAPLGHLARALGGDGETEYRGKVMPSTEALRLAGLKPLDLREKDGHAIIVANSLSTGTACLALEDVACLIDWSLAAAALNYEAFRASLKAIDEDALAARPAFGQREIGARLRAELSGSGLWQENAARRLQDPLSFRCVPQVWGGLLHAFEQARLATEIELGHSGDNPVILPEAERVVSNGNFDLTAFTLTWENLGQALAHCAVGTANRSMKLMSPTVAELPRFLSAKGGSRQGYAELQKPVAALEAEIRHLANPMSLSPLAISDGVEDQSSMAPRVVAKTAGIIERLRYMVAMELIFAATGVELRGVLDSMGEGPRRSYEAVRALVAPLDDDREMSADMARVARMVAGPRL
ncbi:histidine ammonia-lyase [Mesorhizobium sp. VK9D]|uniref:HAL/PAL/TAL family ammonia-lyase n=1 Tax=Mesorhizobium australafricanum TaxID=3072311 RepID=UPI002A244FDF|nr:histidine ammonia-lyase [Mesorhizobium sp. VK9D]MDX8452261.1 histidine ammonia-lyase [Mesorhizobium sp. VK9D]